MYYNPSEEKLQESEKPFETLDYHVNKVRDILERQSHRVQLEKEAFDSVAKKLEHVHFSPIVKLNVGGQIFTTSLQTLTKDAGSMLHAMFSGRFDTKPAEDGSYFIDRDGTCFRYILNYLRTGDLLLPEDSLVQKEVLQEAKFYQVQGIVDKLDLKSRSKSKSVIMSSDQAEWLAGLHGEKKFSLLYRGSRDGWGASIFHSKCDYAGPTMVVVKSTGGYIFGGYTERSWREEEDDCCKEDYEAFIFGLALPIGTTPVQMKIGEDVSHAVYCKEDDGPTFGCGCDGSDDYDLHISSYPNSNNCSFTPGSKFQCPDTSDYVGLEEFNVSEIEVFRLESNM